MTSDGVRADVLLRLRKLSGQVQGIARMVEADRYCVDVLPQLSAVQSAVEAVSKAVTRNYLERCVTEAINGGDPLIYDESCAPSSGGADGPADAGPGGRPGRPCRPSVGEPARCAAARTRAAPRV